MIQKMKIPLTIQFTHLILAALWNSYGVYLLSIGQPSQGPTASLSVVGMTVIFGVLFYVGARFSKMLYIVIALIAAVVLLPSIAGAFYKDPSLWTSSAWRWGGALLNLLGVTGAIWGIHTMRSLPAK